LRPLLQKNNLVANEISFEASKIKVYALDALSKDILKLIVLDQDTNFGFLWNKFLQTATFSVAKIWNKATR
jgi:hypothetical protein